jgi:hypothetical protein
MRVLVCGGRDYGGKPIEVLKLCSVLDEIHGATPITVLIHGDARGADRLAATWARRSGVSVESYQAEWNKYGKAAGHIRNVRMLEKGKPELVVAFPGGTGTEDMCEVAKGRVPVRRA